MIEVYTSVYDRANQRWNVIGPSKAVVDWFCKDSSILSDNMARACNLAHTHATDATARRVRELEEALSWAAKLDSEHKDNCPVPDLGLRAMYRQKWREAYARAALAGKERSDGAE